MKITRDGKTYELTASEIAMAWEEHQRKIWRYGIEDAIDRNSENLRFGSEYTMEEFVDECMDEFDIDDDLYSYADQKNYDKIVFSVAEINDVWVDDPGEEDDNDEI